ncbi:MAG TPA: phage tail protein [Verrucomicrobiota bacterium]|nr:phage tail protein [Verrucomicrobiota bacterium]
MGSSKKVTTGYNYFGSFAQAICYGPVSRLTKIRSGETVIWEGDLTPASANDNGSTTITTGIGEIFFRWGTTTQGPSVRLTAQEFDFGDGPTTVPIPAWLNVCYFLAWDVAWGSSPQPPTLTFDIERHVSALDISAHNVSGDAVIPEVIYDLLTHPFLGGIDPAFINTASFVAAAEQTIDEGIVASPVFDENTTIRDTIENLLFYIDGYLRYRDGKIAIGLMRKESHTGLPVIDESKLADEPRPSNEGWSSSWSMTRAVFTDRENDWEQNAQEIYHDAANAALAGERKDEEVRLPFVTRRSVAKILARKKGLRGGLPRMTWEMEVLPTLRNLKPGSLARLNYAELGIEDRVVRVLETGRSLGEDQTLRLIVEEEITRDETNDYTPPADNFATDPNEFTLASTEPRLAWIPPGLKDGKADGFLIACRRPGRTITGFSVWWTWNPLALPYREFETIVAYPAFGQIIWWTRTGDNVILRIRFQNAPDAERALELIQDGLEPYAVSCARLLKTVGGNYDQHQVKSLWLPGVTGGHIVRAGTLDIEVETGLTAFAADPLTLETTSDPGRFPCQYVYLGRREDFCVWASARIAFERELPNGGRSRVRVGKTYQWVENDTELKRHIKALTFNARAEQSLDDTAANVYDRDDTTMSPDGTFTTDWGRRAPTLAELFDVVAVALMFDGVHPASAHVTELNSALKDILWHELADPGEFPTPERVAIAEDADNVLGFRIHTRILLYNTTL